ncbi:hypothetical protein QBC36DRAFT_300548 [Triangularia setosa]|uniref:Uncharacterized protein n=1 Tax=Triangularia setosa TaxID=2587417 RepID=A0AAN7A7N1_9PEZI|nr:hypothetical protein QBC36DRAFT_300548 [Podospora setosa]
MQLPKSILLSLAIPSVLAHPGLATARSENITPFDATQTGIQWTGKIFLTDAEPTVLYGTAEDIYGQIHALNPDYDPDVVNPDPIAARDRLLGKRAETLNCRSMATGGFHNLEDAYRYLNGLGSQCAAPAKACRRMTCKNTSATYLCSEGNPISESCRSLADMVIRVVKNCCGSGVVGPKSGSVYRDRTFSVWAGYGNCNHATTTRPTDYPHGSDGGPNRACS